MERRLYNGKVSMAGLLLLALIMLLAACSSSTSDTGSSSNGTTPTAATTASDPNHTSLAQLVGTPVAKATNGTSFEVTGQVKNLDTKQHDIFVQATLTDASGKVVGTSQPTNADNIKGGATDDYDIKGTLTQPTWTNVTVKIVKVTENVNGSGDD